LLRLLVNSTMADVARKLTITDETVLGVLKRWVNPQVNWDEFEHIEVVGIDEIALKRGHRDYVTLVTVPLTPQGGGGDCHPGRPEEADGGGLFPVHPNAA
jgi:transposase